jgi:class 3 adenylate cyclase
MTTRYRYRSLDDFLKTVPLHVDGTLDDGWGAQVSVKGREIDAAILFCDITAFTTRTAEMTSTQTLILVNNFFAWITAEALQSGYGIVDKYIGDEMMVVFSGEFGSEDPVKDALQAAHRMCDRDVLGFAPHVGVAAGRVTVGYVGSPLHYSCSVIGSPVVLAARCAAFKPPPPEPGQFFTRGIAFPAALWDGRQFDDVFPPRRYTMPDGEIKAHPQAWALRGPFEGDLKGLSKQDVLVAASNAIYAGISGDEFARLGLEYLLQQGRYWPPSGGDGAGRS